jgi:hypothetical protein
MTALRPVGVPGAHRSTLDLHPIILVSFILMGIAASFIAKVVQKSWILRSGLSLVWLGAFLFSINVMFILATGDDAPVWVTHYSSIFFVALGTAFLGIALFRTGDLQGTIAIVMILATVALFFSQMQDSRVLFWLPLGIAWFLIGLVGSRRTRLKEVPNSTVN